MTIDIINSDCTVAQGDALPVALGSDPNGRAFEFDNTGSLFDYGTIEITGSAFGVTDTALFNQSTANPDSGFHNEAGAHFDIANTSGGSFVYGYFAGSWGVNFANAGTFTVEALGDTGTARGITTWSPNTTVDNEGFFGATAGDAGGVTLVNGGTFANSGTLDIEGQSAATAVTIGGFNDTITNSGSAISHRANGTAIGIEMGALAATVTNSGLIEADLAYYAQGGSTTLLNTASGVIIGAIQTAAGGLRA